MAALRAFLASTVVALSLIGCSAVPTTAPSPAPSQAVPTYLATYPAQLDDARLASGVAGALSISDTGCWGLGGEAAMFPEGTSIRKDGRGIILPDGVEIELGEQIETGGAGPQEGQTFEDIPPQCEDVRAVLYFVEHLVD